MASLSQNADITLGKRIETSFLRELSEAWSSPHLWGPIRGAILPQNKEEEEKHKTLGEEGFLWLAPGKKM